MKTRLVLFSGFLGSGKTTLMVGLARELTARGSTVSLVTNDQSEQLVDTSYARQAGFETREIAGGCFCCRFTDLVDTLLEITKSSGVDYILAEAVGSCTDILSTVIRPLQRFHGESLEVWGFYTLADGLRFAREYVHLDLKAPLLPQEVLLRHQIAEGSSILVSKRDLLSSGETQQVKNMLLSINQTAQITPVCSQDPQDIERLTDQMISEQSIFQEVRHDLDYSVYAAAEREYGWYNGSFTLSFSSPRSARQVASQILVLLQNKLDDLRTPVSGIAHLKLQLISPFGSLKAGISGRLVNIEEGSDGIERPVDTMECILNMRIKARPEDLGQLVTEHLFPGLKKRLSPVELQDYRYEALVPGDPVPVYRL